MSDIRCLAPTLEIEEEDLSMEHMRVIDGWSMYRLTLLLNRIPEQTDSLGLQPFIQRFHRHPRLPP